ncbi:NYN domain-containing protein [Chloroflexota bacterium]
MVTRELIAERQLAVLIDFENTGLKSIQWLFDQVSDIGRIIVKRAYADWSVEANKRDQLLELGVEPVHLFRSGGGGKNSSDIRLAIDAIELLHQSPVDTFIIVSSDSDFVPLVSKLRSAGKTVIGAGREAIVSRTLVRSCDRYFYLEQGDAPSAETSPQKEQHKEQVDQLLMRAVRAAIDEQGRVVGSKLGLTLQRLEPSFDYRTLGYSTLIKFIEAFPWLKILRPKGPGDVTIEFIDPSGIPTAQPPSPETWQLEIDAAWSKKTTKPRQSIPGPTAAMDASRVLGFPKLSASPYKTLQKLLESSELLNRKWSRAGNTIIRK